MRVVNRLSLLTSALCTLGAVASAPTGATAEEAKPLLIEEIVVTARKRDEAAFVVPVSLQVLSSETLSALEIINIHDLSDFAINFSMNPSNGRQAERPTIRGQSSILGAPNAAFFIDGNYINAETAIASQLMDAIERVEIIRGPQAALFGRSTLSGAVNYVTKTPSDTFQADVRVGGGSNGSYTYSVLASGPVLGDKFRLLGQIGETHQGTEWTNQLSPPPFSPIFPAAPTKGDNSDLGEQTTTNYFGKMTYLGENIEVNLTGQYSEADDSHYAAYFLGASDLNCRMPVAGTSTEDSRGYYCGEVDVGNRPISLNIPDIEAGLSFGPLSGPGASAGNERQTTRVAAEVAYDIDDWLLETRLSYSKDNHVLAEDSDRTGARSMLFFFNGTVLKKETEDKSAEIRLFTPQDGALRGFIGAYYYNQRHTDQRRGHYTTFGSPDDPARISNSAMIGSLDYDVSEALTLTAEARYAKDRISLNESVNHTFDSLTPRFAAIYELDEKSLVYANAAMGTKPGGFNVDYYKSSTHPTALADAIANGRAFVEEESAWTYEVGFKKRSPDGRFTLNAAAFYIDWSDQQITSIAEILQNDSSIKAVPILVNLGESEIKGIELEALYRPADRWSLGLAYGLADSEITKGNDPVDEAALSGNDDPDLSHGGNLAGRVLPNAPKHSANGHVAYEAPINDKLSWFVRGDVSYETKKYAQVHNLAHTGDRTKVNIKLGIFGEKTSLEFYGKNIFDDDTPISVFRYVDFISPSGPNGRWRGFGVSPQPGAHYGVTFRRRF